MVIKMSNLGGYQKFTTLAKKFGGVEKFIGLISGVSAVAGVGVGVGACIGGSKIVKSHKEIKKIKVKEGSIAYTIITQGESNERLKFDIGDTFYVLETDGDAILIEKIGDTNNPYFVDRKLLNEISNYNTPQ